MKALWIAILLFLCATSMLILSQLTGFQVETIQSNGLPEIYFPYWWISYYSVWAALWLLVFSVTFSLSVLFRGHPDRMRDPFLGSGLFSGGIITVLFAALWSLLDLEDEGGRCLGGCSPSLLRSYQMDYTLSVVLAVLGLVATLYGGRLLVRRKVVAATGVHSSSLLARQPVDT